MLQAVLAIAPEFDLQMVVEIAIGIGPVFGKAAGPEMVGVVASVVDFVGNIVAENIVQAVVEGIEILLVVGIATLAAIDSHIAVEKPADIAKIDFEVVDMAVKMQSRQIIEFETSEGFAMIDDHRDLSSIARNFGILQSTASRKTDKKKKRHH